MLAECSRLAIGHVDMMFHVLCDSATVSGSTLPPGEWACGEIRRHERCDRSSVVGRRTREEVLTYVAQDVKTTLDLATTCEAQALCVGSPAAASYVPWHCPRGGCPWRRQETARARYLVDD